MFSLLDIMIRRPVATTMIFLAAVTFGWVSYQRLPIELMPDIVGQAQEQAKKFGTAFEITNSMEEGFKDADIVYAKSWGPLLTTSDKNEGKKIQDSYQNWITDERKMKLAKPEALYMHPLPADRSIEVTDGVIDGANSVVYDEAENRLHAQKAVMALTMS